MDRIKFLVECRSAEEIMKKKEKKFLKNKQKHKGSKRDPAKIIIAKNNPFLKKPKKLPKKVVKLS